MYHIMTFLLSDFWLIYFKMAASAHFGFYPFVKNVLGWLNSSQQILKVVDILGHYESEVIL